MPWAIRARGFTLMEMLVTLVLVSFATMLMFQMLGSYRIAKERVVAQSGGIDRRALFDGWFRDSVQGLHPSRTVAFRGDARGFSGISMNAAASTGRATRVDWMLHEEGAERWEVGYGEFGREHWRLPMAGREVRFAYLDPEGKVYDTWPPKLGTATNLPAAVVLMRVLEPPVGRMETVAAVRGPLQPVYAPFELEQD